MRILPIEMLKNSAFTILAGFVLTWILDIFTIIISKMKIQRKNLLFILKDFLSVLIYSLLIILIFYYFNNGMFRGIYIIEVFFGAGFYFLLFAKVLRKLTKIILAPFEYIVRLLIKIARKIFIFLSHTIEKIWYKLYNNNKNKRTANF